MTEEEFNSEIAKCDEDISIARAKMISHKKKFYECESELLTAKLKKEELIDNLRIMKAADINQPPTYRELDIERFKEVLPSILEKLK